MYIQKTAIVTGVLIASLGLSSIVYAKNHVNCEEHIGSRIWEMDFLDTLPEPERQKGMPFKVPESTSGVSRRELLDCIKKRVEEISSNRSYRYSIFPYAKDRSLYVIREVQRK